MEPKDALAGRYELLEQIGGGERAVLFHARDHQRRQMVTVKRFEPARLPAGALARYAAAIALLKRSSVPGAVLPIDVVTTGTTPFATFSPLLGGSVAQLITRGGPFAWPQAADIVARCAIVLSATLAATGQSHRALKPSNLWLSPTGEVSVLDFGIAELGVYAVPPRAGPVFVEYRAPEQIDGAPGDARADVFVLGILLYELATGVHPFAGSSAFHVARQLILSASPPMSALTRGMSQGGAREAEKLLTRSLARAPAERFASAQEFLQALEFARQVIGSPSRLAQPAEAPASNPAPARPVVIVEDPSTIIQAPGLGAQRRANPARPQAPSSPTPPATSASSPQPAASPPPATAPPQPQVLAPLPPQPVTPRAVASPLSFVPPPRPQPRGSAPVEQNTEPLPSPPAARMTMLPAQPCERTEVLPSPPLPPAANPATERDLVPARPSPLLADDELRTVALIKRTVRPAIATVESTLVWPTSAGAADDLPTALHALPILAPAPAQTSMPGPIVEETLLLPPDQPKNGATPALLNDSTGSGPAPAAATPASRTHKILIALNLLCVVLVLCGLLLNAML